MPRNTVIATYWQDAWGTAGTQAMKPNPHTEGLGSYAEKFDDRLAFLAFQQTDTVFSEDVNFQSGVGDNVFIKCYQCRTYYSGWHPQMLVGFDAYRSGPTSLWATFSVRLGPDQGGIDFGTLRFQVPSATTVLWYADIPDDFDKGEYTFQIYGAADTSYFLIDLAGPWMTLLPTRL